MYIFRHCTKSHKKKENSYQSVLPIFLLNVIGGKRQFFWLFDVLCIVTIWPVFLFFFLALPLHCHYYGTIGYDKLNFRLLFNFIFFLQFAYVFFYFYTDWRIACWRREEKTKFYIQDNKIQLITLNVWQLYIYVFLSAFFPLLSSRAILSVQLSVFICKFSFSPLPLPHKVFTYNTKG